MARRRKELEQVNHERWLVSYADFITLLFAFFVVMYAISSVNEGKYRVLSETLKKAFSDPVRSMQPIQVGSITRSGLPISEQGAGRSVIVKPSISSPLNSSETDHFDGSTERRSEQETQPDADAMSLVAEQIRGELGSFIEKGLVEVENHEFWLEVDMKSRMLFASGSAQLSAGALEALQGVIGILIPLKNAVHVEGYTDNVPINTPAFPSNWELSAARAASVVHYFTKQGMAPSRLAAIGYGEHRPITDNATAHGRQNNRRVSLLIMRGNVRMAAGRLWEPVANFTSGQP